MVHRFLKFSFYLCFIALFLEIPAYGAVGCDGEARNAIHKLRSRIEEQEKKVAINVKSWPVLKTGGGILCGSEDGDLRRAILKIHKYMNDLEAGTVVSTIDKNHLQLTSDAGFFSDTESRTQVFEMLSRFNEIIALRNENSIGASDSSILLWPTAGKVLNNFDASRRGIDIVGQIGQPVVAADRGTVLYASNMRGYGNLVIIDHSGGIVTAYAHNKTILVREGMAVARGQKIAEMGNSDSDIVKLHFEVRQLGKPVDPKLFLAKQSGSPGDTYMADNVTGDKNNKSNPYSGSSGDDKQRREERRDNRQLNLEVSSSTPNDEGDFSISVKTNADTASLKINGEEQGGRQDGVYLIKRVARAGQITKFSITAKDIYGNVAAKSIEVNREIINSADNFDLLNPANVKASQKRDAVAIIVGVAEYKNLPKADFADDDARMFYDYAIRALGIRPENIKLLINSDADQTDIYRAFRSWLPGHVKNSTNVYVFYSGHGLPASDGKGIYLLPPRADRDFLDKTAISNQEIVQSLQAVKPKSVTIFFDSCYSGISRSGETLLANARPIALKTEGTLFPENFTIISASQFDQISSSNPKLSHGIFSYFLMKGMEGGADKDRDGKITVGEMASYLQEHVPHQAGMLNRKQVPQVIGDPSGILVEQK